MERKQLTKTCALYNCLSTLRDSRYQELVEFIQMYFTKGYIIGLTVDFKDLHNKFTKIFPSTRMKEDEFEIILGGWLILFKMIDTKTNKIVRFDNFGIKELIKMIEKLERSLVPPQKIDVILQNIIPSEKAQ